MRTRTVDARTVWAVLAMEAGLALPIISLPTQGDRIPGLLGPILLLALLPLGYVAVRQYAQLRDPSWRLLIGIGLALFSRALVGNVPEPGLSGVIAWFARAVAPTAIGVALWWRGGSLAVAELTAADVRTEFSVLAACMLALLAFVRPFVLHDETLLDGSVGVFAVGGLIAVSMSRQDAAEATSLPFGRTLATGSALLPALAAVLLVGILRPELIGRLWTIVVKAIELVLTPIGWLLAWLASLFPGRLGGPALPPPPPQLPDLRPDPAALADMEARTAWIGTVILIALIVAIGIGLLLVARILLSNWIGPPPVKMPERGPALVVERSGTPRADAQAFLVWLRAWLRARVSRRPRDSRPARPSHAADESAVDAWTAYQRLLAWAARHGLARRPAETTGQLQARLTHAMPAEIEPVKLITSTYEADRYGELAPAPDRLRGLAKAVSALTREDTH